MADKSNLLLCADFLTGNCGNAISNSKTEHI